MRRALFAAAVVVVAACDRPSSSGAPAALTSSTSSARPVASAPASSASGPASSASAASSAAPAASDGSGAATWKGAYKAKVGAVNPPKDAKIQLWAKDEGAALVGDGTVRLTITGTQVHGEAKGVLGEQTINGVLEEKELSARVDPKNPNTQDAMTGVLTGKLEGSTLTATLRVSGRNGNLVREATFPLTRE